VASLKPGDPVIATSLKNLVDFCEAHGVPLWAPPAGKSAAGLAPPVVPTPSGSPTPEAPLAQMAPDPSESFVRESDESAESAPRAPGRLAAAIALGFVVLLAVWWVWPSSDQPDPVEEAPSAVQGTEPSSPAAVVPPPAPPKTERDVAPPRPSPREDSRRAESDTPRTAASPQIEVLTARVCTDFERQGTPDWRCTGISGGTGPGVFTFYTRIRSRSSTTVEHRWYYGDRLHMRRSLTVGAGGPRLLLNGQATGKWSFERPTAPCFRRNASSSADSNPGGRWVDQVNLGSGSRTALRGRRGPRDASSVSWRIPRAFSRGQALQVGCLHRAFTWSIQPAYGIRKVTGHTCASISSTM
jgi:hypothetical protein